MNKKIDTKRPNVVVVVFVEKDNKYLVGKRIIGRGKGQWAVVGGHLEWGETFEEACQRETMEETGLPIRDVMPLMSKNYLYDDGHHVVCLFFKAELSGLTSKISNNEPDKHAEWGWFSLDEWPFPTLEPTDEIFPFLEKRK